MNAATLDFLDGAVKLSTPLLLSATGELVVERSGVLNLGVEGLMLSAAFGGFWAARVTGSPYAGVAAGIGASVAMALLFAFLTLRSRADQIVAGTGINLLAAGLTGAAYRGLFGQTGEALTVRTLPPMVSAGAPAGIGRLLAQNALVYLALALVPAVAWFLSRSGAGLAVRAAGEEPKAADAAGVDVLRVRLGAVMFGAVLAGLGGAFLSVGHANTFAEGMSAGRGFIALAIVIFGRWSPWGVLGASLLFGAADAAQFVLQSQGYAVPYQLALALPYVVTLAVLFAAAGRTRAPAALAQPYVR